PDMEANKIKRKSYVIPITGGTPVETANPDSLLNDKNISPDGSYLLSNKEVKLKNVFGSDFYPELTKTNTYIYDNLNNRHWDTWEDGKYDHVFLSKITDGKPADEKDIMPGEPYDCPQKPFGGDEDYVWSPDGKYIVYCTKKKFGVDYAKSTNTDLYQYNIATGETKNLTAGMMGYDQNPQFNKQGALAWLSMKRDGFEADKQDIIVSNGITKMNLTASRDDIHVEGYRWSNDGREIYFWAPINGTLQLFVVNYPGLTKMAVIVRQLTKGDFDINNIIGQSGNTLVVSRTDMNHAAELYTVSLPDGNITQLTHVNDAAYKSIGMCRTERRWVQTTDNKKMLVWVVYPPDFDATKKYPTLLYCQGGPQSPLTQFYSFRWNLQLMASNGYIVVAPNRRGMPGHGTKWNEDISKDHGGQAIRDYFSAIDALAKEKFVDKNRLGCVGASYGGYSVFMIAGVHNNRFKSFIAHDGIFDMRSMYGSTEEIWFPDWDYGGAYWDKKNAVAMRTYSQQNPVNFVEKWNTPIMVIHGGKDYRVPAEQGMQAFQAAQLKGIKSRFLYLPEENHWVLAPQNGLVWQREFYKWLGETLPEKK
ncbi:MAG TPA: S9 family peptidase, partial [Chitinophagaceae bacterium]|nr:S9 family peptidase [Chitinophagaceae bacterium]